MCDRKPPEDLKLGKKHYLCLQNSHSSWYVEIGLYTGKTETLVRRWFGSATLSCLTVCDPIDCSMPRLPVNHQTPRVHSNSCPLSWWYHQTTSSSVIPFSSHLQSLFPASGSFQMRQLFTSGGQSIGVSASMSVHPMKIQDWFPLG